MTHSPNIAISPEGWASGARRVDSPNRDARSTGALPDMVVVHAIALPPGQFDGDGVERLFTNRCDPMAHSCFVELQSVRVSAHFFVRRDGELVQFVSCLDRAWHAGVSRWRGREGCNDFSIGIELEGGDDWPFEPAQYAALDALLAALRSAYPIRHLVGHCHIAPTRKTDPGPFFDWVRYGGEPVSDDAWWDTAC
jgi:AmpD protein